LLSAEIPILRLATWAVPPLADGMRRGWRLHVATIRRCSRPVTTNQCSSMNEHRATVMRLFEINLVMSPEEIAAFLDIELEVAVEICEDLEATGFIVPGEEH